MQDYETVKLNPPEPEPAAHDPRHFRRLRWDEIVVSGDFVVNQDRGFELWEGPSGFRADSFLTPIYRRKKGRGAG